MGRSPRIRVDFGPLLLIDGEPVGGQDAMSGEERRQTFWGDVSTEGQAEGEPDALRPGGRLPQFEKAARPGSVISYTFLAQVPGSPASTRPSSLIRANSG